MIKVNSNLNENYSFDNFVEGDCNRLSRNASYAIASNPGKTAFNPFFVYSKTALGKTHLAHAIGLEVKNNFPEKTVLYISAYQFLTQYLEAYKQNTQTDFVKFYQYIDVFIIDDIQYLFNHSEALEFYLHTIDYLIQNNRQVILTSDKSPNKIDKNNKELFSRLNSSLSSELLKPDLETRIAIIEKKLYKDGIEMPKDVIEYIAYKITTNVRELEGALISILAESSLNKKAITLELTDIIIKKFNASCSGDYKLPIPGLRRAFQQYLSYFDEYVKETKKYKIHSNIQSTEEGLSFDIEYDPKLSVEDIEKYLNEYTSFIYKDKISLGDKLEIHKLQKEVEILEKRITNYKTFLYNEILTVGEEHNFYLSIEDQLLLTKPNIYNNVNIYNSGENQNTELVIDNSINDSFNIKINNKISTLKEIEKLFAKYKLIPNNDFSNLNDIISLLEDLKNNNSKDRLQNNKKLRVALLKFAKTTLNGIKNTKTILIDFPEVLSKIIKGFESTKGLVIDLNMVDVLDYINRIINHLKN